MLPCLGNVPLVNQSNLDAPANALDAPAQPVSGPPSIVEVWKLALPPGDATPEELESLAPDELTRAEKFRVPGAAAQFVRTRAALRRVLATHLGVDPAEIRFATTPHGKPQVVGAGASGASGIEFSVTHCAGLALIAVGRGQPLGIDAEPLETPAETVDAIVGQLGPEERRVAAELEGAPRTRFLLERWVGREALAKAVGLGLGGIDATSVRWPLDEPVANAARSSIAGPPQSITANDSSDQPLTGSWVWRRLNVVPTHVAALVTPTNIWPHLLLRDA